MAEFQRKGLYLKITRSKPFLFVFFVLVIFLGIEVFRLGINAQETKKNKKLLEKKMMGLEKRRTKLIGELEKLKTESGIEENIREKFPVAKEGESVILLLEEEKRD